MMLMNEYPLTLLPKGPNHKNSDWVPILDPADNKPGLASKLWTCQVFNPRTLGSMPHYLNTLMGLIIFYAIGLGPDF